MAKHRMTNCRFLIGNQDFTAKTASVELPLTADVVDVTGFSTGTAAYREKLIGLKSHAFSAEGFLSFGTNQPDPTLFTNWGSNTESYITLCPVGKTTGYAAYSFAAKQHEYGFGGTVGDAAKFTVAAEGTSAVFKGVVMLTATTADTTSSFATNGPITALGAVGATQSLYATLHMTDVSANSSVVVSLVSDDSTAFSSATTRGTFTATTANVARWMTPVAGAITDTYWRAVATVTTTETETSAMALIVTAGIR